ncbi:MAG: hypothetical protein ACKPKO_12585, partial [Candidatus Fonsibacter sp.]
MEAKVNQLLVGKTKHEVYSGGKELMLSFEHVKAHSVIVWNAAADAAAARGLIGDYKEEGADLRAISTAGCLGDLCLPKEPASFLTEICSSYTSREDGGAQLFAEGSPFWTSVMPAEDHPFCSYNPIPWGAMLTARARPCRGRSTGRDGLNGEVLKELPLSWLV